MLFQNGSFFLKLEVMGYEFPDLIDQAWDSDWLNIKLKIGSPFGNWEAVEPCMTTFEMQELVEWLQDVIKNWSIFTKFDRLEIESTKAFLEPNLGFHLQMGAKHGGGACAVASFSVFLGAEYLPPFKEIFDSYEADSDFLKLSFQWSKADFESFVEFLQAALHQYPVRVGR